MYSNGNDDCLWCGSNTYKKIDVESYQDYHVYSCGKCGYRIAQCIRATDGDYADIPAGISTPTINGPVMHMPHDVHWHTWEVWWDRYSTAVVMHGRPIAGTKEFLKVISELSDYDS